MRLLQKLKEKAQYAKWLAMNKRGNISSGGITAIAMTFIFLIVVLFMGGLFQGYLQNYATQNNITIDSGWTNAMGQISSGIGNVVGIYVIAAVIFILVTFGLGALYFLNKK